MAEEYPFTLRKTTPEEEDEIIKAFPHDYSAVRNGVICEPGKTLLPKRFTPELARKIYNFKLRPDDVWIVTYPKCGTTWTQEMVWEIVNNCDFETAKKIPLLARSPFLEVEALISDLELKKMDENPYPDEMKKLFLDPVGFTEELESPRIIKSHLPLDMLPPKLLSTCKVVFVSRNPKDCCVSFYHHTKLFKDSYGLEGSFEQYAELFLKGLVEYGNYFHHLKTAWKYRDNPNLKIIWYENMKKDIAGVIKDVSEFLGKEMTDEKISSLVDFLHIDNFRKVSADTFKDDAKLQGDMVKFFRKGEVGDWKNYFSDNDEKWKERIQDELQDVDINFIFSD